MGAVHAGSPTRQPGGEGILELGERGEGPTGERHSVTWSPPPDTPHSPTPWSRLHREAAACPFSPWISRFEYLKHNAVVQRHAIDIPSIAARLTNVRASRNFSIAVTSIAGGPTYRDVVEGAVLAKTNVAWRVEPPAPHKKGGCVAGFNEPQRLERQPIRTVTLRRYAGKQPIASTQKRFRYQRRNWTLSIAESDAHELPVIEGVA